MPSEDTSLLPEHTSPEPSRTVTENLKSTGYLVLTSSPINWLLVFVPLGILSAKLGWGATPTFVLNFLGVIPLASVLAYATEELGESIHNNSIAGLLNATFGNAVEVIVSIIALSQNQITVVQASMLGSILSNLLLVLGCCFVAGGVKFPQQFFNQTVAQTMSSLMALSVIGLLLPAAFHASLPKKTPDLSGKILAFSRGNSILLLLVYGLYLFFQLKTHAFLFKDPEEHLIAEVDQSRAASRATRDPVGAVSAAIASGSDAHGSRGSLSSRRSAVTRPKSIASIDDNKESHLTSWESVIVLAITTLLVSLCADYLVSSIDAIVESTGLSKTFIGLVVIPIVGNAAEHVTAVLVATKNKMDLAVGVAVGSSIQIALFVTPLLVLIGWIFDVAMSLYFSTYETAVMFVAVFITNFLILDGESNWLEGAMLICTYLIIAISFYLYPDDLAI